MNEREKLQMLIDALEQRRDASPADLDRFCAHETDSSKLLATSNELGELASIAGSLATALQQESERVRSLAHYRRNGQLSVVALPPEVLSDIFVYACSRPSEVDADHSYYDQNLEPPESDLVRQVRHTIGVTCRRWREVLLSTTLLWSSISIEVALQDNKRHEQFGPPSSGEENEFTPGLGMLELELARSGTRPLRFRLFIQHRLEIPIWFFELVRDIFPRCRAIYLKIPSPTPFAMPLEPTSAELPRLQSLGIDTTICGDDTEESEWRRDSVSDLSLAPALQHFAITYPIRPPLSPSLQLIRLHMDDIVPFADAVSVIRLCPQLRELAWVSALPNQNSIPQEPLLLPLLDELWFVNMASSTNHYTALPIIVAPQLSSLHVAGEAMLPTQFPSLRRLATSGTFIYTDTVLVQALQNYPMLEELRSSQFMLSELMVEALLRRGPNEKWAVLPCLERVVWPTDYIDLEAAKRFLVGRNTDRRGDEPSVQLELDYYHADLATISSLDHLIPWVTLGQCLRGGGGASYPVDAAAKW